MPFNFRFQRYNHGYESHIEQTHQFCRGFKTFNGYGSICWRCVTIYFTIPNNKHQITYNLFKKIIMFSVFFKIVQTLYKHEISENLLDRCILVHMGIWIFFKILGKFFFHRLCNSSPDLCSSSTFFSMGLPCRLSLFQ